MLTPQMNRSRRLAPLSVLFGLVSVACAEGVDPSEDAADATADESDGGLQPESSVLEPLLSVPVDQGRTVEIYEPSPGHFMIGSKGPIGAPPVIHDYDLSGRLLEIYTRLLPEASIPAELEAAQGRQDLVLAALPPMAMEMPTGVDSYTEAPVSGPGQGSEISDADEALSVVPKDPWHDFWEDTVCDHTSLHFPNGGVNENCVVHRTGGGSWNENGRYEALPGCMSYDGDINCRLRWKPVGAGSSSYQTLWDVSVPEGFYNLVHYWATPLGAELDWRLEVYNASGDAYHRMFMVSWNFCDDGCFPSGNDVCLCPIDV